MVNLRHKFLQTGCVIALGTFLIANAKPLPQPEIEPSRIAGASKFPIVDWRETKVTITPPQPEIETVTQPQAEEIEEVEEIEIPKTDAIVYDTTFFELVVQAEGYTLGYTGMRYIASAIINLARSRGCSVDAVLTSGAYTVVNNGSVWRQSLYLETIAAVEDELYEGQIDTEIKYFRTNYYHGFGTPCFNYGNVYFSK